MCWGLGGQRFTSSPAQHLQSRPPAAGLTSPISSTSNISAIGQHCSRLSLCAPALSNTLTYLHPHLPSALLWKGQGNQNDFVSEAVQLSLQRHLDFVCATLSTTNCGKFFKRWEYQTITSASWEIYMQVKKQQLELDMEQWTGSKLRKEYLKAVYCHPAYLTYMQSTSCEMPG